MRIEPNLTTTPAPTPVAEGGSKVSASKGAVREVEGADAVGGFSPTADLTKLLAMVKEVPEVRADVVQEVQDRAAVGELLTRTAANDTAAGILDAQSGS